MEIAEDLRSLVVPCIEEGLYVMPSTVCNLACRFCAYSKSRASRQVMAGDTFITVIQKACEYGFRSFNLTPLVGEPLTDPSLMGKMELLDKENAVESYCLCTNLTLAAPPFLYFCRRQPKLRWLSISLYGQDLDSFRRITRKEPRLYFSILENLEYLSGLQDFVADHVEIRMRTEAGVREERYDERLRQLLERFRNSGVRVRYAQDENWYDTWSGVVSIEDLKGLDIRLSRPQLKQSPCVYLFRKHTVWPDGRLGACSRSDADATMIIGDLLTQSFKEIYSAQNRSWMDLIAKQFNSSFPEICVDCTAYRRWD